MFSLGFSVNSKFNVSVRKLPRNNEKLPRDGLLIWKSISWGGVGNYFSACGDTPVPLMWR